MSSTNPLAAVCQVTSTPDKEANFAACKRLVEQAKERGACMVFLPEGFDYIGSSRDETLHLSESMEGEMISRYATLARCVPANAYLTPFLKLTVGRFLDIMTHIPFLVVPEGLFSTYGQLKFHFLGLWRLDGSC